MPGERTPILPSSAQPQTASNPRRRYAFIVAGVVAVATILAVGLNVSHNLSPSTASTGTGVDGAEFVPTVTFPADANGRRELLPYCEEKYFTQYLNQFEAGGSGTYEQRYFVCGKQFFNKENGSIFFYNGNEADVLLYLNNTGLMWENAEEFNAVMVFAEHRYFGKSMPFGGKVKDHMQYLSSTQALADFAVLIQHLKDVELEADVPVIGFGGSYGGMLGTWFRLKYPHLMDGVIAASAPVLHFVGDPEHPVDSEAFDRIVTFDMSPAAGSSANCIPNVRKATDVILRLAQSAEGRDALAHELRFCNPDILQSERAAQAVIYAMVGAFGNMAMGNYPYPTSYIMSGAVNLPGYPVRAACEALAPDFGDDERRLLAGLREAVGVYYNATGAETCYFPTTAPPDTNETVILIRDFWGYMECSEMYMPVGSDNVNDVFPSHPANVSEDDANCFATWGVHLRPTWAVTQYGGLKALRQTSNIVFTNGNYDPWSGTGLLETLSESVVAVPIEGGAHHLDLFFEHPLDPPSLKQARATEKAHMRKWVREFYARKAKVDAQ